MDKISPLLKAQLKFALKISKLIILANEMGYEVKFGMAYRPPEMAQLYAQLKKGIANSLHEKQLAIDLLLFKDGKYLVTREDYLPVGQCWLKMKEEGFETCWGGNFSKDDSNHFSIKWGGVA